MRGDSSSQATDLELLQQLDLILEHDKLIDEVGFIHPTQFTSLDEGSSGSPSTANLGKSADGILNKDTEELHVVQYDKTVFWINNHKLAISIQALPQLYNAALHAYMDVKRSYKQSIRPSLNKDSFDDTICGGDFDHFLESEVLKHSRVLLILSYDFKSAWNSRKLVLSRKQQLSLFMNEFQLSTLILSYAPKSESAWSHRRWVIKMIAGKIHDLEGLVGKESVLVKNIAEKSKMNYRAWNHRCWLVLYMTGSERLMFRILEINSVKGGETPFNYTSDVYTVWKEELQWNKLLIQRYIGREALWIHRRFLCQCWMKHFTANQLVTDPHLEAHSCTTIPGVDDFLGEELELVCACLSISTDDELDDCRSQAKNAASYVLWISKQIPSHQEIKLHERLKEAVDLKALLTQWCPEKLLLWERLLG